jgi:hypothetical protein
VCDVPVDHHCGTIIRSNSGAVWPINAGVSGSLLRAYRGNFLMDQIAILGSRLPTGTSHVAALTGKMPDMDKVRNLSKRTDGFGGKWEAGMADC